MGYKRVYLWGMLVFGLASVMAALAPSLPWLIAARALQGMGMAGVLSVNGALVRQIYPRGMLGQGMALNSMVVALSTVMGPVLAAAVLSVWEWRWLFCLHLPLALWVCRLGVKALPQPAAGTAQAHGLSWWDVLLNVVMFGAVFLALDRISHYQPGQGLWWAGVWLLLGVTAGWLYVQRQKPQAQPMLPLDLLRIPVFRLSMGASICAFSAQTMAFLAMPFLLIESHGVSTGQAGLLISAWPLALAVVAPMVGRKIGRIPLGVWGPWAWRCLLRGCGPWPYCLWALRLGTWRGAWPCVVQVLPCSSRPITTPIVTSAPVHRSGAASGMLGTARHVGQALGAICPPGLLCCGRAPRVWPSSALCGLAGGFALLPLALAGCATRG